MYLKNSHMYICLLTAKNNSSIFYKLQQRYIYLQEPAN
jgi:hypothetical protein